jgi:O-antigen ligase
MAVATFVSFWVPAFFWVTAFVMIFATLALPRGRALYLFLFLFPLRNYFANCVAGVNFAVILPFVILGWLLVKHFYVLVKTKTAPNWVLLLLCAVFELFCIAPLVFVGGSGASALVFLIIPWFLYLMYVYREDLILKEMFYLLLGGIVFSFAFGFLGQVNEHIAGMSVDLAPRVFGLDFDPNFFANQALIALAMLYVLFLNDECRYVVYPAFAFLCICVILSISKAGLLILLMIFAIFAATYIYKQIKEKKTKNLYCILALVGILVVVGLVFMDTLKLTFGRFTDEFGDGSTLDNITTGRISLWVEYVKAMCSNGWKFLFGHGGHAEWLVVGPYPMSPHNTYFDFLYFFGAIGTLVVVAGFAYVGWKVFKSKRVNWWNLVALVALIICIGHLSSIRISFGFYVLCIMPCVSFRS